MGKKKARPAPADGAAGERGAAAAGGDADKTSTSGRPYTLSMAVCASMIDNTQNIEFATFVAGQVARTAAIFCVDELVVVDDAPGGEPGSVGAGAAFLARVAQYLETPQYLRKALIPMHPDLRLAGALPPLDAPHHMRASEWAPWREGLVMRSSPGAGSVVDIGLDRMAAVPAPLRVGARVTLAVGPAPDAVFAPEYSEHMIRGSVAPPSAPREEAGLYWGYTVRLARGLSGLLHEGPFPGGYDLKLGTSERGQAVPPGHLALPRFRHALVAFGGPEGLEAAAAADRALGGRDAPELFDLWLNTCPAQGSRTIRAEEAILISMAALQAPLAAFGGPAPAPQ
ncbi:Spo [Scenedesmus sp. PABB004]|nr:Spo [Scenedesmus sp. PABB004]